MTVQRASAMAASAVIQRASTMTATAALLSLGLAGTASAAFISLTDANWTVYTANQSGMTFEALPNAPGFNFAGAVEAQFQYTGQVNFFNGAAQNTSSSGDLNSTFFASATNAGSPNFGISGYSSVGSPVTLGAPANANFTNLTTFLASSGSAGTFLYGSFNIIDLGTLQAGTVLTITHDDGVSVFQGGVEQGTTTAGPTQEITESVTLGSTADTTLYYGRENGTPSILEVSETLPSPPPPPPPGVPEPASIGLLGTGLIAFGLLRRGRKGNTGAA